MRAAWRRLPRLPRVPPVPGAFRKGSDVTLLPAYGQQRDIAALGLPAGLDGAGGFAGGSGGRPRWHGPGIGGGAVVGPVGPHRSLGVQQVKRVD
jgi:hypothetical protein